MTALESTWQMISNNPAAGLPAPRPYPQLSRPGRAWVHAGRDWIAHSIRPPAIVAVFYDAADIPGRLQAGTDETVMQEAARRLAARR